MEDKKKPARGLEEVCHLFLSHKGRRQEDGNHDQDSPPPSSCDTLIKKIVPPTPSDGLHQSGSCWLFCANRLFAEKSVVACNLALELARRGFSVGLIETTTRMPSVFFLLGSLLRPLKNRESLSSLKEGRPCRPTRAPLHEPLKPFEILLEYSGTVQAVFFDQDADCAESVTTLKTLRSQTDCLIINAPPDISRFRRMIALVDPYIIVPAAAHSEELLDSYLLVKRISENFYCSEFGHLIIGASSRAKAESASSIVAEMARKFLSTNIHFVGVISIEADLPMALLTRTPSLLENPNSPFSLGVRKVADALIKNDYHRKERKYAEAGP
jgi:cellulose biosynthesis protein BcsQ